MSAGTYVIGTNTNNSTASLKKLCDSTNNTNSIYLGTVESNEITLKNHYNNAPGDYCITTDTNNLMKLKQLPSNSSSSSNVNVYYFTGWSHSSSTFSLAGNGLPIHEDSDFKFELVMFKEHYNLTSGPHLIMYFNYL